MSQGTKEDLAYWREKGQWCCAIPRNDWATQAGLDWKKYGLIGRGKTKAEAADDWQSWRDCADLVADIY